MRRKSELEIQLNRARGTDFADVRTDVVSIGTKVVVQDLINKKSVTFNICGAWDSDPDNGIIAYLSPIGQALLNHPVGAEVEFELHNAKHKFTLMPSQPSLRAQAGGTRRSRGELTLRRRLAISLSVLMGNALGTYPLGLRLAPDA